MITALQLKEKLDKLDVYEAAQTAIQNTSSTAVEIEKDQLFQGIGKDGKKVTPAYAESTIRYKKRKGQPYDRVTRKDTGSYYAGIRVDVSQDFLNWYSTDEKDEALDKKYGGIGLNSDSRIDYIRTLKPEFIRVIQKQIF